MEPSPGKRRRNHHKDFSADCNHAELKRSPSENQEQLDTPPKKKLKSFTYEEKKKILDELTEISPEIICKKYDLSDRTLRYWKSQKEKIFENAKNINVRDAKRIRDTEERDNQLLQWLVENENNGVPISGPLLKKQALIENKNLLEPSNFKASEGWLSGWKKRINIRCLKITEHMEPSLGKRRRKHHKDFSVDVNHAELERSPSENQEQFDTPPKKKLKSFTYEEKKKILDELNEIPPEIICKKYDLSDRTLRYWKSQKEKIFENAKNIDVRDAKRIRDIQERDNQLLQWRVRNENDGVPMSGPLLKKQALLENKNLLGPSNFKASEGWLSGWKKRIKIRRLKIPENMESSPGKRRRKHHKDFSTDVNHAELEGSPSENEEQLDTPPKKKLKSFTYEEKKKILDQLNEIPPEIICKKYDLSDRTLRYWKSQKEKIFENAKNINVRNAKRIRDIQERDNRLLQWLLKNENDGIRISGPLLKKQALIENKKLLGPSNFKASEGWLSGWKKRKNVA